MNLSFDHWLVIISSAIIMGGAYAYIRDTLKGLTKPNRVTWGMWSIAPLISAIAALSASVDPWSTVRVFLAGLLPLIIFMASFLNEKSYWKLSKFDYACGFSSLLALIVWSLAHSPSLAILFAILADIFAGIPTFKKAWSHPETETPTIFFAGLISASLIFPTLEIWDIEHAGFLMYLLFLNSAFIWAIMRKKI